MGQDWTWFGARRCWSGCYVGGWGAHRWYGVWGSGALGSGVVGQGVAMGWDRCWRVGRAGRDPDAGCGRRPGWRGCRAALDSGAGVAVAARCLSGRLGGRVALLVACVWEDVVAGAPVGKARAPNKVGRLQMAKFDELLHLGVPILGRVAYRPGRYTIRRVRSCVSVNPCNMGPVGVVSAGRGRVTVRGLPLLLSAVLLEMLVNRKVCELGWYGNISIVHF